MQGGLTEDGKERFLKSLQFALLLLQGNALFEDNEKQKRSEDVALSRVSGRRTVSFGRLQSAFMEVCNGRLQAYKLRNPGHSY